MKRFSAICTILALSLLAGTAHAQTACSTSTPCVGVSWQNTSMAAAVATNSAGVETAGPGTATIYKCVGAATQCTAAALTAFIAAPTTPSVWSVAATIAQTTTAKTYNDPEPYNDLMNYGISNTWTGGGTSPVSAIMTFLMPAPPVVGPAAPVAPAAVLITSGTAGSQ